ncbi:MAG: hypothetical protein AAB110_08405 [Candidatus Desantisbacteria bacterium]
MNKIMEYLVFFVLLAIISLAVGVFLSSGPKDSSETNKTSIGYLPNLEYSRKITLGLSKLNFPEITSASGMDKSELPQELQPFVFGKLINQTYQRIQYSDGKNGYLIEYALNASDYKNEGSLSALYWLSNEYKNIAKNIAKSYGWNTAYNSSRTDLFALVELENPKYNIRIEQSLDEDTKKIINVAIMVLAK